ncbi:MAG TPA: Xaa-Pro peptidase family protein, partial [Steroidobacteraceae bacterium]|nr:Xaa-Pro peptidase family protein [Steroidobacteraceae bacterium]
MKSAAFSRRDALGFGAAAALSAALRPGFARAASATAEFASMTADARPIGRDEYLLRIDKARRLMARNGIGALLIEPGASMIYFTGVHWWRSERLTVIVLPREGELAVVTPHFEAPSVGETLAVPAELRVWQEDEDPLVTVAGVLRDRKVRDPVGIEETMRYFAIDGLMRAMPDVQIMSGAAIVRGCRMVKSPNELALMQKANDVTMAAYRHVVPRVEKGMKPHDIGALMKAAHEGFGAEHEFALILLGEASAYPHGSGKPQAVKAGEVVLMDCGCNVHGYQSDISRTFVFGEPGAEHRKVWKQVRQGQQIAFETAR